MFLLENFAFIVKFEFHALIIYAGLTAFGATSVCLQKCLTPVASKICTCSWSLLKFIYTIQKVEELFYAKFELLTKVE